MMRRTITRLFFDRTKPAVFRCLLSLLAAVMLCVSFSAHAASVREVIDGDTLVLENGDHVRLIGIDTPEIRDSYGRNAKTARFEKLKKSAVDLYAIEAKSAAEDWVRGQELRIVEDPANAERRHRDDYGRLLAYVCRESDGRCLAEDLLSGGYALVYRRFAFERKQKFLDLEAAAKSQRRGIWKHVRAASKKV